MKINKLILGLGISVATGLFSVSILGGSKQVMKASAEAGDAPTGVEADWTPITSVSDINTSDYYMLRTTYNDSYQYSNSELDFVNGVAWRASSFENARVFQFVEGTDGYKVKGLFNLLPQDIENYHYLHIQVDEYDNEDIWTVDTLEEAAEFDAFAYDGTKITLRKHGSTSLLAAMPVIYGDHAGETTILNMSSEDYEYYSGEGFLLPLELVTCASTAPVEADEFAKTFLSTTNGICIDSSKSTSDTDIDALAAVWNIKETPDGSSLVEKWNALSIGAKAVFNEGTATDDIVDAKTRYVHIMSRYSEQLTAFAEGPVYVAETKFIVDSDLTNNAALIVTIFVAVAISTLSLATLLVIKKRRS